MSGKVLLSVSEGKRVVTERDRMFTRHFAVRERLSLERWHRNDDARVKIVR